MPPASLIYAMSVFAIIAWTKFVRNRIIVAQSHRRGTTTR
jgi:hypothetical protein